MYSRRRSFERLVEREALVAGKRIDQPLRR